MTAAIDAYAALGLPRGADATAVKDAYRRLARQLHPDVAPGREAEFRAVTEAYRLLSDPDLRAAHDAHLAARDTTSRQATTTPPPARDFQRRPAWPPPVTPAPARAQWPVTATSDHQRSVPDSKLVASRLRAWRLLPAARKIRWWVLPAVYAALIFALWLQMTGLSARTLGIHPGSPVLLGTWRTHPVFDAGAIPSAAKTFTTLAVAAALVTAAAAWRRWVAPTPKIELWLVTVALFVTCAAGQFLAASTAGKVIYAAALALYAAWLRLVTRLPRPADDDQWASFPRWAKALAAHYRALWAAASR